MEPELTKEGHPPARRGCLAPLLIGILAATLGCVGWIVLAAMHQRIHTALATLDGRLVLQVDSTDPAVAKQTWKVLRARLRRSNLPGRLASGEGARIVIEHRAQDADAVRALATTRGELRFMLVNEALSELERKHLLVHLVSVRRPDGTLPDDERLDALPLDGELLVLERPGIGGAGTFEQAFRARDDRGLPAFGFELTDDAAARFRALTGANLKRRLAIVLDGQVRSAPTIRGAIGAKGIIEGGAEGWDEAELERLITLMETDPLSARLIPVEGK